MGKYTIARIIRDVRVSKGQIIRAILYLTQFEVISANNVEHSKISSLDVFCFKILNYCCG